MVVNVVLSFQQEVASIQNPLTTQGQSWNLSYNFRDPLLTSPRVSWHSSHIHSSSAGLPTASEMGQLGTLLPRAFAHAAPAAWNGHCTDSLISIPSPTSLQMLHFFSLFFFSGLNLNNSLLARIIFWLPFFETEITHPNPISVCLPSSFLLFAT